MEQISLPFELELKVGDMVVVRGKSVGKRLEDYYDKGKRFLGRVWRVGHIYEPRGNYNYSIDERIYVVDDNYFLREDLKRCAR